MIIFAKKEEWPTWLVAIGDYVYEMNERANLPNGVCLFFGDMSQDENLRTEVQTAPRPDAVPYGIALQAAKIALSQK